MLQSLIDLLSNTGFFYVDWRMAVMWLVSMALLYLAVYRQYEPLLLVPIAFGALLANLPTLGMTNKPANPIVTPVSGTVNCVVVNVGQQITMPRVVKEVPNTLADLVDAKAFKETEWAIKEIDASIAAAQKSANNTALQTLTEKRNTLTAKMSQLEAGAAKTFADYFKFLEESTSDEARTNKAMLARGMPNLLAMVATDDKALQWKNKFYPVKFFGRDIKVSASDKLIFAQNGGTVVSLPVKDGDKVLGGQKICEVYNSHAGGLYYYIQMGVLLEIFPPLIFLGVGALTDFGPLIANPKTLLLGAAAQFGVLATFFGATILGFSSTEAASIGIIGGADGPTSIFTTNKLAPHLLAPIAVAAYSYMALVPVIQPPIMRLLTTQKERKIRMSTLRKVSKLEKLIFAIVVTIFCIMLVPDCSALIGMLMLGNFLRECGVCERISKAAQNELINVITIFLGTSVGITMTGDRFLRADTIYILILGVVAFGISTAAGVLFAKGMNLFLKNKINPLIGSAGVSAVPMAARVSQVEGQKADPSNFLMMHAMGPNVAGVIGTAVVAGFFIASLKDLVAN